MDAQQRLLLERGLEALHAPAGTAPDARTAVVVGIGTVDYTSMSAHLGVGIYVATGMRPFIRAAWCKRSWPLFTGPQSRYVNIL